MFDWGFPEFILVGVVGMLVFGPERLPEVARNVGQWVGKTRRYLANLRADFESDLNAGELRELLGEQQKQIRELKDLVDDGRRDFASSMGDVGQELTQAKDAFNQTIHQPLSAQSDEELFGDDEDELDQARSENPVEPSDRLEEPAETPPLTPEDKSQK